MLFFTLEHILTHISFSIILILISINLRILVINEIREFSNSSKRGMITTFLCITGFLVTRWTYLHHFPLNDLADSLIFLSWSFSIIHIILYFQKQNNNINSIITLGVLFTQGFATSGLLTQIHESEKLVPALQSQWLLMHVSMIILGYASLLCGSLLSVALLAITFQKGIRTFVPRNGLFDFNKSFSFVHIQNRNQKQKGLPSTFTFSAKNFYKFQLIQQLDLWSYRVISVGFIFLTIGILSGSVWANEAWGSYWNWDPKETWAFITWTLFTIYLHTKTNQNVEVKNSAIVAFLGFLIIWVCYFGVNLLEIGLHSYGSF